MNPIKEVINHYPEINAPIINSLLQFLTCHQDIKFIYVAGAITFNKVDKHSDLDVHCIVNQGCIQNVWECIDEFIVSNFDQLYATKEKHYPWFGNLKTFFIACHPIFSFDIGLVEQNKMQEFYFQYKGIIIKDENNKLYDLVKNSEINECFKVEKLRQFHLDQLVTTTIKINKDIARKHFWNAQENLMQLRRSFIFLFSYEYYYNKKFPFIGRPERDIEDVWSSDDLRIINVTTGSMSFESLANAVDQILSEALQLNCVVDQKTLVNCLKYIRQISSTKSISQNVLNKN
jgi:hypothetical protein